MSQARIYTTKKVQKDWVCGKCREPIRKGIDGRISFAVGFRGREQTRCTKPECRPTRSELESSAVGQIFDVIDGYDISTFTTADDFTEARDAIVEAINEVAGEYESNEMYEINYDLQERVSTLEGAASELESWEPENEQPDEDEEQDCDDCDGTGKVECEHDDEDESHEDECETCSGTGRVDAEDSLEAWLDETRESFESAVNDMELP